VTEPLRIEVSAEPENLAPIRRQVAEHAEKFGLPRPRVEDLKTIVSEACANVIRHAYEEHHLERPLEIEMRSDANELDVIIRDRGRGIQPRTQTDIPSLRMGLPIIGALSASFRLSSVRERGTELRVCLPFLESQTSRR
jgi:anti-sigma regulatory factor (Ser/Thr protein kinase)